MNRDQTPAISVLEERQTHVEQTLSEIKSSVHTILQLAMDIKLIQERQATFKGSLDKAFEKVDELRLEIRDTQERQVRDREFTRGLVEALKDGYNKGREEDRAVFLSKLEEIGKVFSTLKEETQSHIGKSEGVSSALRNVWLVGGGVVTAAVFWIYSNASDGVKRDYELDRKISVIDQRLIRVESTVGGRVYPTEPLEKGKK